MPNGWWPRPYQRNLWDYLERGGKRAVAVWHRRAGKDDIALHWTACAAMQRVGTYWHMLPEASQARKAIWTAINPHTHRRRIDDAFPRRLRRTMRENEMFIELRNGSTWQLVGSDNFNSLVGSPPVGIVFSEFALANPQAWSYLRPILAENGGWAVFISTPRGRNHLATFFSEHLADPAWFCEQLRADQTGVFPPELLALEKREYVIEYGETDGESRFNQEYLVDFDAAIAGAYYGREMKRADEAQRITSVPWEPQYPVFTAWDLGISDSTAIWWAQWVGRELHVIDYIENSGVDLGWYANQLRAKPYTYADPACYLPHDAAAKELGTGKSRQEMLASLQIKSRVLPAQSVQDGINAGRMLLASAWIDRERCKRGIECLRQYRREWDDKRKTYHDRPLHDWASHGADAWRYLAMGIKRPQKKGANEFKYDMRHVV